MAGKFNTIHDMMDYFYGTQSVKKSDDPVLTSTTGVYNAVYGAMAFSQLNNETNAFGILPKFPWRKSGWRVITADAGTVGDGGVAEDGSMPDTIKPTFAQIDTKPKQVVHTFQVSMIHEGLVQKDDDNVGDMEFLRSYFATRHAKDINKMLLTDVDTTAGNNFESLDRVCSNNSEASDGSIGLNSNDADIYGLDRDTSSDYDAVVDHNSGTDRTFKLELLRSLLADLEEAGARTNILLTGSDTKWRIFGLAESSTRYNGVVSQNELVRIGINGVETEEGMNFGVRVATVYNIPLFVTQDVKKDTISRIYALDTTPQDDGTPRLGIALLYPTMYMESGMAAADKNPFAIDYTGTKGAYYTAGELICTGLPFQGKIRDLK